MNYNKVGFVTLGCEKNRVDMEIMMSKLNSAGFNLVDDPAKGDIVVVNTCAFIDAAKSESIEEILELSKLKNEGRIKSIVVTGCLAERFKDEIKEQLPEVDIAIGLGSNKDIVEVLKSVAGNKKFKDQKDKLDLPLEGERIQSTPGYFTYLKIAEGCDNFCSYCVIPIIRGRFRSRNMDSVIEEAKAFAAKGVKELNVIAQDITRYGEDNYKKRMLPTLLKQLCKVEGIEWIRLLYCYPDRITDELLDVIASEDKILKYMDLPLQHCNGRVLKAMNRYGDRKILSDLIKKIRNLIPGVTIRTTFIVGFPGETEEEFNELCEFANEMNFERMGAFTYSQEESTKAAQLPDQVDEEIKAKRLEILMEQQYNILQKVNKNEIGKIKTVLTEGFDRYAECYFGRSESDAPDIDTKVFYKSAKKLYPGDFANVKVDDVLDCDLIGEVI